MNTDQEGKTSNTFTGHWSSIETMRGESKASEKSKQKVDQQNPKKIKNWTAKPRPTLLPISHRSKKFRA